MGGVVKFGIPFAQVLELTPAQYSAAQEACNGRSKELDMQLAWVRQLLAEPYRDSAKRPTAYTIDEMMVFSTRDDRARSTPKEQTAEEQIAYLKSWTIPQLQAIDEIRQRMEADTA